MAKGQCGYNCRGYFESLADYAVFEGNSGLIAFDNYVAGMTVITLETIFDMDDRCSKKIRIRLDFLLG